jgi:hypothetical protein
MAGRAHRSQRLLLHNPEREIVGLFKQFVCHMGLEELLDPRKRLPTGDDGAAADKGDGLWMDSPCTAWVLPHTNVYGQNVTTRPTGAALCDLGGFSDPGRLGRLYTSPKSRSARLAALLSESSWASRWALPWRCLFMGAPMAC